VALSGYKPAADIDQSREPASARHFVKPVNPQTLPVSSYVAANVTSGVNA
jgi:hypothetical protein